MNLPEGFIFSQGSLQDFVDCRRRFQLRYLKRLAWPALETEPALEAERYLQQGALFHRMVQQHLLGVPAERLSPAISSEDLGRWWANYLEFHKDQTGSRSLRLSGLSYPEVSLSRRWVGTGWRPSTTWWWSGPSEARLRSDLRLEDFPSQAGAALAGEAHADALVSLFAGVRRGAALWRS